MEDKKIVEALLFSSHEMLSLKRLREVLEISPRTLKKMLEQLKEEYADHAFQLEEGPEGYQLRTRDEYSSYMQQLHGHRRPDRLSKAALEVIAIIAYRQPITRPSIDAIRGVDSSGTLHALIERGLVEKAGKATTPGKPTIYGTTQRFLSHFGLQSIEGLKA